MDTPQCEGENNERCDAAAVCVEIDWRNGIKNYNGWRRFCCSKHAYSFNPNTTFVTLDEYKDHQKGRPHA